MAKSENQKKKLLLLEHYLLRETDAEHPVTMQQILDYLAQNGVSAERKSIYSDLETLRETVGLDINVTRGGRGAGYYVDQREFQLAELCLMVDSIQASRFITEKRSEELITKLSQLASRYQAQGLRRQVIVKDRVKTMNKGVLYNIDSLHEAIAEDKRVSFRYFHYDPQGKLVPGRGGARYEVSPFALVWDNENYYLIGYEEGETSLRNYRVDKMQQVNVLEKPRAGRSLFEKEDMARYADSHFGMFGGRPERVKIRFTNDLAGSVIDRFGNNVMLIRDTDETFTVTVDVTVSGPFLGWLCIFGKNATVLWPQEVRERVKAHLDGMLTAYSDEKKIDGESEKV